MEETEEKCFRQLGFQPTTHHVSCKYSVNSSTGES